MAVNRECDSPKRCVKDIKNVSKWKGVMEIGKMFGVLGRCDSCQEVWQYYAAT